MRTHSRSSRILRPISNSLFLHLEKYAFARNSSREKRLKMVHFFKMVLKMVGYNACKLPNDFLLLKKSWYKFISSISWFSNSSVDIKRKAIFVLTNFNRRNNSYLFVWMKCGVCVPLVDIRARNHSFHLQLEDSCGNNIRGWWRVSLNSLPWRFSLSLINNISLFPMICWNEIVLQRFHDIKHFSFDYCCTNAFVFFFCA